jgi:hypothetical protein
MITQLKTPESSAAKIVVPIAPLVEVAAIDDPIIDLLKQLLPVDSPVGTVLERFRSAVSTSMTGQMSDDAIGKIITLLKALPVDLKTVTGDQLRSVIDRLGLRYEPMLQAAFSQRVPVSVPQLIEHNLKAALLTLLEAPSPYIPVNSSSPTVQRGTNGPSIQQPPLPATIAVGNPPEASFIPPSAETLEAALLKLLKPQSFIQAQGLPAEGPIQHGPDPQQPGSLQQLRDVRQWTEKLVGAEAAAQLLQGVNTGGRELKAVLLKLLQALPEPSPTASHSDDAAARQKTVASAEEHEFQQVVNNNKATGSEPKDSLVDQIRKLIVTKLAAAEPQDLPIDSDPPPPSGLVAAKQLIDVRQQAHELLGVIERTQVLNSVNNERGEPLTFQIPFLLDGRASTAQFYVERRLDEGPQTAPEERHYSVVALLELSELGALRVDLALHKKHLSVKVTVENEETAALASRLLPELGQTLNEQGFAVELLKCERKIDGSAKGEDLRDRTLPDGNGLVNLRV